MLLTLFPNDNQQLLLTAKGQVKLKDFLKPLQNDGYVLIYCSASWCGPCRGFTPKLADCVAHLSNAKLIFVSACKNEAQFKDYFASMPSDWAAVPYEDADRRQDIFKQLKISTIPSLHVLSAATGEVITTEGKDALLSDPTGVQFPWKKYKLPLYRRRWFGLLIRQLPMLAVWFWWRNSKQRAMEQNMEPTPIPLGGDQVTAPNYVQYNPAPLHHQVVPIEDRIEDAENTSEDMPDNIDPNVTPRPPLIYDEL